MRSRNWRARTKIASDLTSRETVDFLPIVFPAEFTTLTFIALLKTAFP